MTAAELHVLQHSLGVDQYGRGNQYRNRFVTGPETDDFPICRALVALGFMVDHDAQAITGGMHCFSVTDAGRAAMASESLRPPKRTRGQERYAAWLRADCPVPFIEWCRAAPRPGESQEDDRG